LKIIGQVLTIGIDSVAVKTMTGELKFPVIDIVKIETGEPIIPLAPAVPEKTGNVSTSLKQVGYGCLGGVVGGSLAGLISIWGNGFGDGRVAGTLILGAVIAGIIIGAQLGGTK
jgi:predicted lipid-binding transport protein (Tim44 family)